MKRDVNNKKKDEFVKDNLLPIKKENIGTISNCSRGENNIFYFKKKARSGFEPL